MSAIAYSGKDNQEQAASGSGHTKLLRIANTLSFLGVLAANGLAGGKIGEISRKYSNDIVPDGWAFSICERDTSTAFHWTTALALYSHLCRSVVPCPGGIIYSLLFGFVVFSWTERAAPTVDAIGWVRLSH